MLPPYANEPYPDFTQPGPAAAMRTALDLVASQADRYYPLIIGGERITTDAAIVSANPAAPGRIVGRTGSATPELADRAIHCAAATYEEWRAVAPVVRARIILKAAAILRRRIYEFSAWLVVEVSKSWIEAYADAAEAVDFLELYAREMMRLAAPLPSTPSPGEENEVRYVPLGVGVVISPWNFPLAIMAGMTAAAAAAGNTVVVKPASQAPIVAAKFMEVLEEAGLPAGVVNFVPGPGSSVGDVLVDHPLTRFISFTGSREVGVRIHERAAKVHPGQKWLKRTILEMGGKDAIIVDETADIDAAAAGAVASAFGYQGQKCSACSRLIVVDEVHDALMERVLALAPRLTMGDPACAGIDLGAVVDPGAVRKIYEYIEIGRQEGDLVYRSGVPEGDGQFVPVTIIDNVAPDARIAQEEIFGPVLAVIRARDFDHALEIANGTDYGLTGALFSGIRARLERARADFHVGNLYLNRKCTGALVDVQPFGGFNMSGTDSKAGGRDYLQLFMQGKSVAEKL